MHPDIERDPDDPPIGLEDVAWLITGWIVLYGLLRWLRTDGSEYDKGRFDDGWWPVAIGIGWPIVYWALGRIQNWAVLH
jgi:hypothetical protein